MKQVTAQAIVLGRINFGEADRILTLLTNSHGKIGAVAKGVRRPKSRLAGGVELFTIADIVFFEGKSELKTLVSAQLKQNFSHINSDMARSTVAYDVLKYTNLYTESVCEDSYFDLVQQTLTALNAANCSPEIVWIWFGIRLLGISGHAINTETDATGQLMRPEDHFHFDYQNMAFQASPQGMYQASHIKLLRLYQSAHITPLQQIAGAEQAAKDLHTLITESIKHSNS